MLLKRKMADGSIEVVGSTVADSDRYQRRTSAVVAAPTGNAAVDTPMLAEALAAGGVVDLSPGTYLINDYLTFPSRTLLRGCGMGITTIKVAAGATGGLRSENFTTLQGTGATDGVVGVSVRDLTIDGNVAAGGLGDGLSVYGAAFEVEGVAIKSCAGKGLWTAGNGAGAGSFGWPGESLEAFFSRLRLQDNRGGNWAHGGPNDSIATQITGIMHATGQQQAVANVLLYEDGPSTGGSALQLNAAHLWGAHAKYQLHAEVTAHRITNVVMEGAWDTQMFLDFGDGGGITSTGLHVFGFDLPNQRGIVLNGVSGSTIQAHGGNLPGGFVDVGTGDWGRNRIVVNTDDSGVIGTRHANSVYEVIEAA